MKRLSKKEQRRVLSLVEKLADALGLTGGKSLCRQGDMWEKTFSKLARQRGIAVSCPGKGRPYDRIVNGLRTQCKSRKTTLKSGKIDLCYSTKVSGGAKRKGYIVDSFDVLAIMCEGNLYLIPSSELKSRDGVTYDNVLNPSDFKAYIDNWAIFDGKGACRDDYQLDFSFLSGAGGT